MKTEKNQIGGSTVTHFGPRVYVQCPSQFNCSYSKVVEVNLASISNVSSPFREGDARLGEDRGAVKNVDPYHAAPEGGRGDGSSKTWMTYLILFLLGVRLVLVVKRAKARKHKALPKKIRAAAVWKIVILVSSLGCLLSCGVANDEYKVSCYG